MKLENAKIRVTPEQSEKIQKILLSRGIFWVGGSKVVDCTYGEVLYIRVGCFSFGCYDGDEFNSHPFRELNAQKVIDYYEKQKTEVGPEPDTGMKFDAEKPRFDLIPPRALLGVATVLEFGVRKYAPNNWKQVENAKERYTAALLRHMNAIARGETHDKESGLLHSHCVTCNAMFLAELEELNEF